MRALDLTGQRFGRLVVIKQNKIRALSGHVRWDCVCDCQNPVTIASVNLTSNGTSSCGCLAKEITSSRSRTHGMSKSSEYRIWAGMIQRCININDPSYSDYGGRGITVCERWLNSFENFYEDIGPRPSSDHSIDREEVDGNYEKDNCRWATREEQANNKKDTVFHEYKGSQYTIPQLSGLPEAIKNNIASIIRIT